MVLEAGRPKSRCWQVIIIIVVLPRGVGESPAFPFQLLVVAGNLRCPWLVAATLQSLPPVAWTSLAVSLRLHMPFSEGHQSLHLGPSPIHRDLILIKH